MVVEFIGCFPKEVPICLFCRPGQRRGSEEGGVAERYFKPVFRKIPADEEVQEGALCRFDCLVSGRPMPEIYWYRDNEQVKGVQGKVVE